ncbi:MAG TPA: M56 family metallopeptidase, partial [Phenylobacterium sp.]
ATPLPREWVQRCRTLQARMGGSLEVAFRQSAAVAAPLVAGWLKPMVLIPTAALVRLPCDQLEALILHELAHVRRLDAFANLIQAVVETLLFYHPAVWWVSRRVRIERENCCDDLAVGAVCDPALYVRALQAIEAMRPAPAGALAANGGDLKRRAARILGLAGGPERPALSRTAAILLLTAAGAAMTHGAAVQAEPVKPAFDAAAPRPLEPVAKGTAARPAPPEARPVILAELAAPAAIPALSVRVVPPASLLPEAAAPVAPIKLAALATPAPIAAAAAGPPSVSGVTVNGQAAKQLPKPDATVEVPGYGAPIGQFVAVWPSDAYHNGLDGRVRLSCKVDVHGLAERCEVASEYPRNKGFGRAALQLRPTFKLKPTQGADGPIDSVMSIDVSFVGSDRTFESGDYLTMDNQLGLVRVVDTAHRAANPLNMRAVTMLDAPVWVAAPNFDDLARAYPEKGAGEEGYAAAHCQVQRSGALDGCFIIKEVPQGRGFGKAALGLASKFRVSRELANAPRRSPIWVDVPIRLPPPAALDREIAAPVWISTVDARRPPRIFPPEAASQGLTTGRGVARCTVGPDGGLTACAPEPGDADPLGFSAAAARIASTLKMNLWSADAAPVEGGVVHVPVRLNLKGG